MLLTEPLTLYLEKNGETKTISFRLSPVSAAKKVGDIKRAMKEKWNLVDVTGGTEAVRNYIKNEIESYNANPKEYSVSVKKTISVATKVLNQKEDCLLGK